MHANKIHDLKTLQPDFRRDFRKREGEERRGRAKGKSAKGSAHASEHFFKLENELFGFRIGSSLAYVAVD